MSRILIIIVLFFLLHCLKAQSYRLTEDALYISNITNNKVFDKIIFKEINLGIEYVYNIDSNNLTISGLTGRSSECKYFRDPVVENHISIENGVNQLNEKKYFYLKDDTIYLNLLLRMNYNNGDLITKSFNLEYKYCYDSFFESQKDSSLFSCTNYWFDEKRNVIFLIDSTYNFLFNKFLVIRKDTFVYNQMGLISEKKQYVFDTIDLKFIFNVTYFYDKYNRLIEVKEFLKYYRGYQIPKEGIEITWKRYLYKKHEYLPFLLEDASGMLLLKESYKRKERKKSRKPLSVYKIDYLN